MIAADHLRPPSAFDQSAAGYKDWLHVNVFDHESGCVGLINTSLHGAPGDARSRAVGVALVDVPGTGWVGNVEIGGITDAALDVDAIRMRRVAVALDTPRATVTASALLPEEGLSVSLRGHPVGPAIVAPGPLPLGPGWIGWYALPRLELTGALHVGDRTLSLDRASGYCDHNWGRWHWGEDLGWDWGSFLAPGDGPTIVLSRVTDRARYRTGAFTLEVRHGPRRRTFIGASVSVAGSGTLRAQPRRLPGAMAALHSDRAAPDLPAAITIQASDGNDRVDLVFTARSAAQLVLADPTERGFGFLHEITGTFHCEGRIGGSAFADSGLAVVERAE